MVDFSFYEFMNEALAIDTDAVDLERYGGSGYKCPFTYNGKRYTVILEKEKKALKFGTIDNLWIILFKGPDGYKLTRAEGTAGSAIYSRLLACVKKLLETHEVDGIEFSPFEDEMMVPYDLFCRTYLLPDPPRGRGFRQMGFDVFVSKDWLERNKEKLPSGLDDYEKIIRQEVSDRVAHIKGLKAIERQKKFAKSDDELMALERKLGKTKIDRASKRSEFLSQLRSIPFTQQILDPDDSLDTGERNGRIGGPSSNEILRRQIMERSITSLSEKANKVLIPENGAVATALSGPVDFFFYKMPETRLDSVRLTVGRPGGETTEATLSIGIAASVAAMSKEASGMQIKQIAMRLHDSIKTTSRFRYQLERTLESFPPELRKAITNLGIIPRAALAVKRAGKEIAELPGEVKRYYFPKKNPPPPPPMNFSLGEEALKN